MFGTRELLDRLAAANPDRDVCEERLRRAIRTGQLDAPSMVAGRFVWREADAASVARALDLNPPTGSIGKEVSHAS